MVRRVLRRLTGAVNTVHVARDDLAQGIDPPQRTVGMVRGLQVDGCKAGRGPLQRADLRLTLAQIHPVRVAVEVAELGRLVDGPDDAHEGTSRITDMVSPTRSRC